MKEIVFVRKNMGKWKEVLAQTSKLETLSPETIADLYQELSADLAFAQTHYPDSELVPYLNSIALKLHNRIYGCQPQRWQRIKDFWAKEIPMEVFHQRRLMAMSLGIFVLAAVLGAVSTIADPNFANQIMGDRYIDMTLRNIAEGNPMGVYGRDSSSEMMLSITLNNIEVSFVVFVAGMLTCFASGMVMIYNGVMLGTFMTFCAQHGVLADCLLAMWMHGMIEITAIIVSGGAGLVLGSGWLYPGSLPRLTSFRLAAKSGVKIVVGLVPCFVVAGFIESYVTRYTDAPLAARLTVILGSLALLLYYFVYLPYKRRHG